VVNNYHIAYHNLALQEESAEECEALLVKLLGVEI